MSRRPAPAALSRVWLRWISLLSGLWLLWTSTCTAQPPYSLRTSALAALMTSRDQIGRMAYDRVGVLGDLQAAYAPLSWLDLQLGVTGGTFLTSGNEGKGGLIAPLLGALVHVPERRIAPFLAVDAGSAITGNLVRPMYRISAGVDIAVRRGVTLGPVVGYAQVIQKNGLAFSTDARFLFAGLSVGYRPEPPPRPKPIVKTVFVRETVTLPPPPAPEPPPPTEPELMQMIEEALPGSTDRVELLAPVLFAFDSDALEPIGVAMLHEVANLLKERADIELVAIQGYADQRGTSEYNQALSERRATRVLEWLVAHGIAPERLQIEAAGANRPVEAGSSEAEYQQNRRVVFRVLRTREP